MIPSIYSVLLNWNGFDDTVSCIESLKKSVLPLTRIIVLDQASADGSGARLAQQYEDDDRILMICNEKNYGFAEGVNIGIQHAMNMGSEFVFLINNDTIVDKNCLQYLYEVLSRDPSAAAAGPAVMYYSNPGKLWQGGGFFSMLKMGVVVPGKGKMLIEQPTSLVTFLTGCAVLIRMETFRKVGLFHTSYFFYMEDVDFALRIREAGMRMYFVPTARVLHKIDDIAVNRTSPFVLYHLARSTVIMLRKRFSGPRRWYGIMLQLGLYTPFRFWQILKGGSGWASVAAWLRGLSHGVTSRINL